jgi:hypothetical protein
VIRCPRCGSERVSLVGYASGMYPASYRCYGHGEYTFNEDDVAPDMAREMRAGGEASRSLSRANAAAMLRGEKP